MITLKNKPTPVGGIPMTEEAIYKQVIGNTEMRKSTSSYEVNQAELDEAINRVDVAERRSNELAKEVNK